MKLRIAAVLVGLPIMLAWVGVWIAQSDWLRERVLTEIVTQAERVTGGAVKLKAFRFNWRALTAEVDQFEIRGTEPADQAPLLTVEKIRVGLTIVSLVTRDIRISTVEAIRPRVHLILLANGKTNIPEPKLKTRTKGAVQTILDLKIGRFDARMGEFLLANTVTPWEAKGEHLETQIEYEPKGARYSGNVSLAKLFVKPYELQVTAGAAMELDRIVILRAQIKTGGSEVELKNTMLHHFSSPEWTGQYDAKVALKDLLKGAEGVALATGSGRFVSTKDYQVTGSATGTGIGFDLFRGFIPRNMTVAADFDAGPDKVSVKRATVRTLGGEVVGSGELLGFAQFKASGRLEHFDLAQVTTLRTKQKLPYDAMIDGPFQIEGTLRQQKGQAQLAVSPVKTGAAVRGDVAVKFDTATQRVELGHSWIDLPHSHLEVAGTLGERLEVKADSSDAADVLPLLLENAKPEIAWGAASFRGTVTGPLLDPLIAGFATGRDVKYQDYKVESVAGDFTLTGKQLTVSKSEAIYQGVAGRAAGSISLTNWQISEKSPLAATVDWSNTDVSKLVKYPITGQLSGSAQVNGTIGEPLVNADVTLNKGLIYGQPYDAISGKVQYLNKDSQTMTGLFVSGPKRVNISARFDQPENLEFNLTSNTMPLNEINLVRERQPDIHGYGKFHVDGVAKIRRDAKGEMQADLASLNADASANSLELGGRNLGDARLIATTKGTVLSAQFDSNAAKASIHGEGTVGLTGDYPVNGTVKFTNAGLNALAALILKSNDAAGLNFDGTAQGDVAISGPLRKPAEMTARLDIPSMEVHPLPGSDLAHSLPKFSVSNSGPIRATLVKSVLRVESARLKAPESDLSLTGTFNLGAAAGDNLGNDAALNLRMQGSVNLALVRSISPDIISSGTLAVDGTVRGTFDTPDVSGRATMKGGEFHYSDFTNALTNVNCEIVFNGTRATIQSLSAESGGGRVDAAGFAAYSAGQLTFRVETKARGVRVRYPEGVSSISDADLTMAGTSQRSNVSGAITVHRVAINPKSDAATILAISAEPLKTASAQNGFASNMNLDVQISTASDVALQTSVTQSLQADANLRLRGTVTNPAVLGRINVTQGEIVFFGNKYSINQGTISFFNAAKIEPVLNVDLETKARGVDVILTVSGPITKLNVSYRSDPPLQFSDILALLATGRAPTDPTVAGQSSQGFQQVGADTLIGQAIANPVAGRLQRFFGVSRLKIDPTLTGITGSPQARLTIEQQVTPDILFTYITDVSSTSTQLIRVEWAFNRNWSAILIREENGYVGLDFAFKKRFR
jgi:translocation and assembly module TamB